MCKKRKWTEEEIEYLESKWGISSYEGLAKKLNRSVSAIKWKAYNLNLGNALEASELLTINSISVAFNNRKDMKNSSYSWDIKKWEKAGLNIENKKIANGVYKVVKIKAFWDFAKKNTKLFNFAVLEPGALGVEPKWVKEIRELQKLNPSKLKSNKPWSIKEINRLKFMVKTQRYTYADISEDIGRSESAVKRKLYDLGIKERPVPRDHTIKWTSEEKEKMIELRKKGLDASTIAKKIGKTELSICDRLRAIGL